MKSKKHRRPTPLSPDVLYHLVERAQMFRKHSPGRVLDTNLVWGHNFLDVMDKQAQPELCRIVDFLVDRGLLPFTRMAFDPKGSLYRVNTDR